MANKKQDLQKLLDQITALQKKRGFDTTNVNEVINQLINKEVNGLAEQVKNNSMLKGLQALSAEMENFKERFDLSSLATTIKELEVSIKESELQLVNSFKARIEALPKPVDYSGDINQLRESFSNFVSSLAELRASIQAEQLKENQNDTAQDLAMIKEQMRVMAENDDQNDVAMKLALQAEFSASIEALRKEVLGRLSNMGGGSMNRQIKVNSSVMSQKYTDVNFKAGNNVTLTKSDDDTNKITDITIAASGGAGGNPAGSDKQIQFNDNNAFGADPAFTWGSSVLAVGQPGSVRGAIDLAGATAQTVRVIAPSTAGAWTLTLPSTKGNNNEVLTTDGNGVTRWGSVASGGGTVTSVVAGLGIKVDNTNPSTPIVSRASIVGDVVVPDNSNVATLASIITAAGPVGSASVIPVITFDAKGRLTTVTSVAAGSGGTPGGAPNQIQFNGGGSFAGIIQTSVLTTGQLITVTTDDPGDIPLTINPMSGQSSVLQQWTPVNSVLAVKGNGSMSFPTGTVSQPAMMFAADDDGTGTGIYRSAANEISIANNGIQNFVFSSGGTFTINNNSLAVRGAFLVNSNSYVGLGNGMPLNFSSTASANGTADVGLIRNAAGVIRVSDASTGYGALILGGATPGADNTYDLGSGSLGFRDIYAARLNSRSGSLTLNSASTSIAMANGGSGKVTWDWVNNAVYGAADDSFNIGFSTVQIQNGYFSRSIQGSKAKTLVDNTATAFLRVAASSSDTAVGLIVDYIIQAIDTASHVVQLETGQLFVSVINTNGTVTASVSKVGTPQQQVTSGTLTTSFDINISTTNADIRATADTSLASTTTFQIKYRANVPGTATLTPQ